MFYKIKESELKSELPDGLYYGTWGGYVLDIKYNGKNYEFLTKDGVRGINVKVVVEIKEGVPTFDTFLNKYKTDNKTCFSYGETVYSLRHKKYGTVKSVDGNKGYVISFSKNKFNYEYHYQNELSKNSN